ncbi:MAG: aryl-sulfate sulfotransferase [Promethearchaeota archaeon]
MSKQQKLKRSRRRRLIRNFEIFQVIYLIVLVVFIGFMTVGLLWYSRYMMFNDGELLDDSSLMICQYEILRHGGVTDEGKRDGIIFVDPDGNVVREITRPNVLLDQPHEAMLLDNRNILVANCRNDSLVEIGPDNTEVWRYDLRKLNWTEFDPAFTSDNYVNNPFGDDWSHVNDIELRRSGSTEYLLISVRNFDMIYEINYTSARMKDTPDPADITWYFGFPGNHSLLNHQHNADYLANGNIMVADSENERVVEINYTTREIVWKSPDWLDLYWVRDADQCPWDPDLILITDSLNHRVFEFNRAMNETTWTYDVNLIQPYQSDYISNSTGQILICDGAGGRIFIMNRDGEIVREYITPTSSSMYINTLLLMVLMIPISVLVFYMIEWTINWRWNPKRFNTRRKINFYTSIFVSIGIIFLLIWSLFYPYWILQLIVLVIDFIVR